MKKKKRAPYTRRFILEGIDLGDGNRVTVWFEVGRFGVRVRRWHGRKRWAISLHEAAELVARRSQVNYVQRRMARGVDVASPSSVGSTHENATSTSNEGLPDPRPAGQGVPGPPSD